MGYAFISYRHDDRAFVERLANQLENAGASVWFDHHLDLGEEYFQFEVRREALLPFPWAVRDLVTFG